MRYSDGTPKTLDTSLVDIASSGEGAHWSFSNPWEIGLVIAAQNSL